MFVDALLFGRSAQLLHFLLARDMHETGQEVRR